MIKLHRYLLCRPQGGLNDSLCQIEYCRKVAYFQRRKLSIQTEIGNKYNLNRFNESFFSIFQFTKSKTLVSVDLLTQIEKPNHSISPSMMKPLTQNIEFSLREITAGAISRVQVNPFKGFCKNILVHESWGGGLSSATLLDFLILNEKILNTIQKIMRNLPRDFVGIHIRNSDQGTNEEILFDYLRSISRDAIIVLFSDNISLVSQIKNMFSYLEIIDSTTLLSKQNSNFTNTQIALIEMLILSFAKNLIVFPLQNNAGEPKFSGFSRLTKHIWVINTIKNQGLIAWLKSLQPINGLAGFRSSILNFIYFLAVEFPRIIKQVYFQKGVYRQLTFVFEELN